nr:C-GCAxxG-C-C family protein [uncultured Schaedlerella sp.]
MDDNPHIDEGMSGSNLCAVQTCSHFGSYYKERKMLSEKEVLQSFEDGICCAMAVFGELAQDIGLEREVAYKIASGFGSGIGYGSTCGCVTGALMALGYKYGNYGPGQFDQKEAVKKQREAFQKEFKKQFGHIECIEFLENLNPTDSEERKMIDERELIKKKCPTLVCATCELARKFL